MSIFLIRHGETPSNAARVVQLPDAPLSPRGIAQAERLAARLGGMGVSDILSSDLTRAVMTAERLQRTTGAPLRLDERLQERNFGDIRGRAYADLGVNILAPDYEPPGGERWIAFHARVDEAWTAIAEAAGRARGHLAVVTHGLVCAALATHHLHIPPDLAVSNHWGNTSLTIIDTQRPWTVRLLDCTAHLDGLTADDRRARSSG